MSIITAAGTRIYVGPVLTADLPVSDSAAITLLSGITYTEIHEVESIGDYGDKGNDVSFSSLGDGRVRHLKGQFDAGVIQLTLGYDPSDAGQNALRAAQQDRGRYDYPFKVVYTDGQVDYFAGKAMSLAKNVGSADNVVKRTVEVGINSEIYEVVPTP